MGNLALAEVSGRVRKKRLNKAPDPRFKPDISEQFDFALGCPSAMLPADHLARQLKRELASFDVSALVKKYSSQGRHGYHPLHMLGALVYGTLIGIHHSTKLAKALKTDLALRFVAGGHCISEGRLRAFRRENLEFFEKALLRTISIADELKLLDLGELATDSVRLQAAASTKAVRTKERSEKRLEELARVDLATLSDEEREAHLAAVKKHEEALQLCRQYQRTNLVLTSPSAGLMKFPDGASRPGHRATVVAAGKKERFVVGVLVDAAANDYGKLGPAIMCAREWLTKAGVSLDTRMQVAGDPGYFSVEDLAFASANSHWVDVLIAEGKRGRRKSTDGEPIFGVDDFRRGDSTMVCPAGRLMKGPFNDAGRERWHGDGCAACGLKPRCTQGKYRALTIDTEYIRLRDAMRERFAQPGVRDRYNHRIATVEPVFSSIEDAFGFRRVSSRKESAVKAEILLKVFAYNLSRLLVARRLRRVLMLVEVQWLC
jgi:transposase